MNMSFYTAAVGASEQQHKMNITANNIANVNTNGFKCKRPSFQSLMYSNITGINNAQLPRGSGSRVELAGTDMRSGPLGDSAQSQSYAIDGEGFFAIVDMASGEVSYTRDGNFTLSENTRLDDNGEPEQVFYLSDGSGRMVLSTTGGPIECSDPYATYPVGVFDFANKDGMRSIGNNRFQPVDKNGQVMMATGTVRHGVIERSNTDIANEMAQVIESQRSFSYALKMVQTSDEIENTVNGLRG